MFYAPGMAHKHKTIARNRLAPNGCHLRRCPSPTGARAMWVERCAAAARNPKPAEIKLHFFK